MNSYAVRRARVFAFAAVGAVVAATLPATATSALELSPYEPGEPTGVENVQPIAYDGNLTCKDLLDDTEAKEAKIEPVNSGSYTNVGGTGFNVTLDVYSETPDIGPLFDFSDANRPVTHIVVKGGDDANAYVYEMPGVTSDTRLHAPVNPNNGKYFGLSHVSFCFLPFTLQGEIEVDKTAAGEWDRTVTWDLDKKVDGQESVTFSGEPDDSWTPEWQIAVTKNDSGPQNYRVFGDVTVTNSSNVTATFELDDVLDDNTPVSLDCDQEPVMGKYSLDPAGVLECEYNQAVTDKSAELNTATVTVTETVPEGYEDELDSPYASDAIEWTEDLDGFDKANFSDDRLPSLDQLLDDDETFNETETFECPAADSGMYVNNYYTKTFVNTARLDFEDETFLEDDASVTIECQQYEGLTPGFWKQPQHLQYWAQTGYSPSQTLGSVFIGAPSPQNSLLQALSYQGNSTITGAKQNLLRAGVAAVLNSSHPDINYPLTTAEVIAKVNAGLASGNRGYVLSIKDELDDYNNLGGVDLKWKP